MADWGMQELTLNGTSLKKFAFGVRMLGGLDVTPSKRGTDVTIGYSRGMAWRPKRLDSVTRTLLMWVDARESDGTYAATRTARLARLNQNIRDLMALFATEGEQLVMGREVLLPGGTETWEGLCEVTSTVQFESDEDQDEFRALSVDLLFADPLWYGETIEDTISGSGTVTNPGEVDAVNAVIELSGGSSYTLTNSTTGITLTVLVSGAVTVDCGAGTAVSGVTNVIGKVSVEGARDFMRFAPGANSITLDSGSVDITFRAPRL